MKRIIMIILTSMFCSVAYGGEGVVFEGTPLVKNSSSVEGSLNQQMSESEKQSYKVVITKEDNKYIWLSRERRVLKHESSGIYDYFLTDRGDYIRIAQNPDGGYLYMEHLTDGFKIITYWGVGDKFEL